MIKPLHAILAATLLLGPVIAAEAGVRTLIASGRLPQASSSDHLADVGLANLERSGRPDVLVLGTSSIRNALQPDVLEAAILESTGEAVRVQGIAQSAISLKAQRLLVRGLASRGLLPDVVVLGITPITLTGDHQDGDWLLHSELGRLWSDCQGATGFDQDLECRLGQLSALWRWRGRPTELLRALQEGMPTTASEEGRRLRENGWTAERPATARELRRLVPDALERLLPQISVPAWVANDFAGLIAELRAQGVTVVTITLPYAQVLEDALVARNPRWETQRADGFALLEQVAETEIIQVQDYGAWWQPRSQHDLRHLSREGAAPFTRQLWELPAFRDALLEGLAAAD